jgi:hypothetical protein
MSTKAQMILEQIRALSPEDRERVVDEAVRLRDGAREWDRQKAKLHDMQSRHAGRGLLNSLLEERAKERANG